MSEQGNPKLNPVVLPQPESEPESYNLKLNESNYHRNPNPNANGRLRTAETKQLLFHAVKTGNHYELLPNSALTLTLSVKQATSQSLSVF